METSENWVILRRFGGNYWVVLLGLTIDASENFVVNIEVSGFVCSKK